MPNLTQYGTASRIVAAGATCLTSANAAIIGILFNGTGTGTAIIYKGVTASSSVAYIRAYVTAANATVNSAVYFPCPAYCSGGITVDLGTTADPDVTLFWNPTGGA